MRKLKLSLRQQITALGMFAALLATVTVAILVLINENRTSKAVSDEVTGMMEDRLAKSAEKDDNERVRAFSTRVLGKLKNPDEAPLYRRLLTDKSPYVRQNAAWALGELGAAGAPALAELQRASRSDPANDVRAAAKAALGKL